MCLAEVVYYLLERKAITASLQLHEGKKPLQELDAQ